MQMQASARAFLVCASLDRSRLHSDIRLRLLSSFDVVSYTAIFAASADYSLLFGLRPLKYGAVLLFYRFLTMAS